ncbi:hypothetical protein O181_008891 [Austropuccinia psidii MF-1]|uniref:Uncharacterized protein n=1 Tax=Austropuccinia psidii MF-1 TaxID=1389203 RepID=A0A9Q3BQP9_9BASI|nr:hypothetical protein [Austropuccinia psidii MF-1]
MDQLQQTILSHNQAQSSQDHRLTPRAKGFPHSSWPVETKASSLSVLGYRSSRISRLSGDSLHRRAQPNQGVRMSGRQLIKDDSHR